MEPRLVRCLLKDVFSCGPGVFILKANALVCWLHAHGDEPYQILVVQTNNNNNNNNRLYFQRVTHLAITNLP